MYYEFKRLSDVEELAAAPEGAKALAVVDGTVKQVPFGGGNANMEDMMFDLEVDMSSIGRLEFTNNEQIQKVYDNNMSVCLVCREDASGVVWAHKSVCPFVKDVLPILTSTNGAVYAYGYYEDECNNTAQTLRIIFDPDKYNKDGTLAVTNGSYMTYFSGSTVVRVYASAF